MSRRSLSTCSNSSLSLDNILSAPKPQRVPSPNLLVDDPMLVSRHHLHVPMGHDVDEYPSIDSADMNFDTMPAFHTSSSAQHSRTSSMASTSSQFHYVVNDNDLDEDFPSSSSISITNTSTSTSTKRPSSFNRSSRPQSRSSWISVHLNTAMQTAVKRSTPPTTTTAPVQQPTHVKRSSIDASASAEIRSIIFARCDDDEEESFAEASIAGMACSPPMRTHNPLIRDTLFSSKPTPILAGATCATSIGSPILTSIGSPGLPFSLAAALSARKGHDHKNDGSELSSPRDAFTPRDGYTPRDTYTPRDIGATTNGGRSVFHYSAATPTPSQSGITAQ